MVGTPPGISPIISKLINILFIVQLKHLSKKNIGNRTVVRELEASLKMRQGIAHTHESEHSISVSDYSIYVSEHNINVGASLAYM